MFIAFLPFPTEMFGTHFDNPAAFTVYAVNVALISGFEVLLFRRAYRDGLFMRRMPEDVFRYGQLMSTAPVVTFLISIPSRSSARPWRRRLARCGSRSGSGGTGTRRRGPTSTCRAERVGFEPTRQR